MESGDGVRPGDATLPRCLIVIPDQRRQPRVRVDRRAIRQPVFSGTRATITGHSQIDQVWVQLVQAIFVEAQLRHHPAAEVLDQHVEIWHEPGEDVLAGRCLQVDRGAIVCPTST